MTPMFKTDRLSTSVNKQPMEFEELNNSRLLEAFLPVKIPKFYFGDISNETSNFIFITGALPFMDHGCSSSYFSRPCKLNRQPLKPYELEGPYDKCIDWTLRGVNERGTDGSEYYYLMLRVVGQIAGCYKAGKFGSHEVLNQCFDNFATRPVETFGINPWGCSGNPVNQFNTMFKVFHGFLHDTAPKIFPAFCHTPEFNDKFRRTMYQLNANLAETNWWRCRNHDNIALSHMNLNVDNAFFFLDEKGELDCGALDFGPMAAKDIQLWSTLYCGDWDTLNAHAKYGGPTLDHAATKVNFVLCAYGQMFG
eukprot:CAMPEP_0180539804 /NCGR_PEP_ID=MMETSP1036_2-20121128/67094_1 /TAXON_ID=632150 /ORGANISM="Azadinium spinosum, Strain 3D9" /LENGTH=307 /DNA_ID=CAMNT_0022554589 /DNA_START=168 /DNA_END=1088 /DNA_ORIENTATION=+